jgi:predicted permease
MGELFRRIHYLINKRRLDAELQSDMEFHREMAARAGQKNFGNTLRMREQAYEAWGWTWLDRLIQDLRYALRMFAKSPGFSAIAILTMALGIGATTAIFSLVDATLLHPLPYPHSEELVRIEDDLPGAGATDAGISIPEWKDLQRSGIFQCVVLKVFGSANLTGASQPTRMQYEGVSPAYFAMLGVKPELGHTFDPQDQTPGFTLDVVISDGLWKRAYGSDPHIVGRTMRADNDSYRVIGVMPPGFRDPGRTVDERNTEQWAAVGFSDNGAQAANRTSRAPLETAARLKPGLTLQAAQNQLDALVATLQKQYPDAYPANSKWTVRLVPLKENVVGNVRQPLFLLFGAVALVLMIGCVNVANLLLARASARSREMAVRQALGAARKRLVRQLLTESLILSLLGGVAGLVILFCMRGFLQRLIPESLPRLNDLAINWTVMLFALAASIAAGVIFGLAPARQAGRSNIANTLRLEGRGSKGSTDQTRTRRVLVVTEFALSLVLMVAAGLLLHSFWDLYKAPLGFNPKHVMSVQLWLPSPNDPKTDAYGTAAQESVFARELLRRSRLLPGVQEAALGSEPSIPLEHDGNRSQLIVEGHQAPGKQPPLVERSEVTPEYFHLLEIPLLRGRLFNDGDNEKAPLVAVVNQAMARTYWRGEDAIGKRLMLGSGRPGVGLDAGKTWITIVGVVADARTESLADAGIPQIYLSMYQNTPKELAVFLRGDLDAGVIPEQVQATVQSVDPELPVYGTKTLGEAVSASLEQRRFSMDIVAAFAITALLLAALGIYGVISYIVSERTRDIGIRLALGAERGRILAMILRQGLGLAMAGAALGLAGSVIVSHLMAGLLYGVTPADPLTFAGVTLVLTGVALAACYVPARRAMQVDPMIALRYE